MSNTKKVINSSDFSKWYLLPEKSKSGEPVHRIRRYYVVDGVTRWERYPAKNYTHLNNDEIASLLNRLNATYESQKKSSELKYEFDHSYVNIKSISAFEKQLDKSISDKNSKTSTLFMLNSYVFNFFIIKHNLPNPSMWYTLENDWGIWLLTLELSPVYLKKIVSTANRFNKFLVDKLYPEMVAPRKLEPLGKLKLDKMASNRKKLAPVKYIHKDDFDRIIKKAQLDYPDIIPNILLAYNFGLRISETQGLTKEKFLKDSVLISEQGDRIESGKIIRKVTKTNERRVPYWNMTAREAWKLVQDIKPMHPDTLVKKVNLCLATFNHTSHDFRRTFITNSLRAYHWKDVQKAAGHTDVRTTMGYNQDDRNLSEDLADLD